MTPTAIQQANARVASLLSAGNLAQAEAECRSILQAAPQDAAAHIYLGMIATRVGKHETAIELIRRGISLGRASAEDYFNLSQPLMALGRSVQAEAALREAVRLKPDFVPAMMNLGAVLAQQGKLPEAESAFREAIRLRPDDAALYVNLGRVCRWQQRIDEAIECYGRAIAINPAFEGAHSALGSGLREAGRISEAVAAFRKAVELRPDFRVAHSNLIYAMHFDPLTDPAENFAEHLRWAAKFAEPLRGTIAPHSNDRNPSRRLRIAYVSPDFTNHVIGFFMEPILERHDCANFEVYCYSDAAAPDETTARLQRHANVWRQTAGASDEQLAQLIHQDRIDILIDLTLHMRGSRLAMFARKPAPVQITHLAYCATSGISAMDWCITDPQMSPPGLHEQWFTEKLLRLKESYWCYRAPPASPPVGPLPAERSGYITFGSLNSFAKVNPQVIALGASVLQAVPNSRLMVHAPMGDANAAARKMFTDAGIDPNRLTLIGRQQREQYLEQYNQIDIALDSFPYGGGTTSIDALWMGVPLITLAGKTALSRTGVTLLSNLDLREWVGETPEQYVEIATSVASDISRLAQLRGTVRQRLQDSPLMNEQAYVRNLEAAYRYAWREWLRSEPSPLYSGERAG
ncbi:MAG TPA: tetratricopeptide repeat protein [Humisphaera sp.]|nr:tetratricopeptide repeat protein [Humisphaera sp.]